MRGVLVIVAMLGAAVGLPVADAAVAVTYVAPPGCPPPSALGAAMAEVLGPAPTTPTDAAALAVEVADDRRSATLRLYADDGRLLGRRTVDSPVADCPALVRAVALSAALAIAPPVPSLPAPAPPAEPARQPPEPAPLRVALDGGVGLGVGLHPGLGAVLGGGLALGRGRWSGQLAVRVSGAPAWLDGGVAGGRVRSGLIGGEGWGCGDFGPVTGCLGALAGLEVHGGVDFVTEGQSSGPWLAGGLRLDWRPWGSADRRFDWGPRLELVAPISRLTLTVDGRSAWRTPALGAVIGIGGSLGQASAGR